MPDSITPVGTMYPPQNPLQSLSSILGIQQQRQALQMQAQELQRSQIQTQQDVGVNQFFSQVPPDQLHDAQGNISADMAHQRPEYQSLPGVARIAVDTKINQLQGQQLQNKTQLSQLNGEVVGQFGKLAQSLKDQSPDVVKQQLTGFAQQGPDQARIAGIYGPVLQKVPPQHLGNALQMMAAQAQDVTAQQSQTNPVPGAVETPTNVYPTITSKASGVPVFTGQNIPKNMGQQAVTYPSGQVGTMGGPGTGGSLDNNFFPGTTAPPKGGTPRTAPPTAAGPHTAVQDAPSPNAPRAVQEAYQAAVKDANNHVEAVRTADSPIDYGNNMQIANQIRKLSKSTDTGPGTDTWHHVLGALGAPIGANNVADYQLLGAYLDRQAAGVRSAMGLPLTNEGSAQSREISGNVTYQKQALQDKNDLTQSLVEGLHQYRNGLDRVAGFSGQASPAAINQFKNAWTQNFDPNVYKGELAYGRSKGEGDAFVKTLSPQEASSLAAKRAALQKLSKGQMP